MTTPATNEFESQFAHLKREEQLVLLERLVHQMRLGAGQGNGLPENPVAAQAADPRFRREWDHIRVDFKASNGDLLSEA